MANKIQIKKVNDKHEALLNALTYNPAIKRKDLAKQVGLTPVHVSVIINSDAFKAELAKRREALHAPVVASIQEKLAALTDVTIERMLEKIDVGNPTLKELNDVLKTATNGMGLGGPRGGIQVNAQYNQVNINEGVDRETLARAREIMGQVAQKSPEMALTFDQALKEVEDVPSRGS